MLNKYPCRNCIYFSACGDNMRTMPCAGRKTKSEKKREEKESEKVQHRQTQVFP